MPDPHEALREALAEKYEIQEVLGEGGMGTVFLARDLRHDRSVAIKTIHPHLTTTGVRERFEREIQITAQLQHPHILPLLDSGVAGETLYYVRAIRFATGSIARVRCRRTTSYRSAATWPPRSTTPTSATSFTVTSSRRTSF
jgi:serine/threonine-protein kinase